MKNSIIYLDEVAAKVAAHAADCYKEAYTTAKAESAKKVIPEVGLECTDCSSLKLSLPAISDNLKPELTL